MVDTGQFHAGLRLRRTREFRGLEPGDLARMLGVGVDALDRLERGVDRLEGAILAAAGRALGVDPSFFFKRFKHVGGARKMAGFDWVGPNGPVVNDNRNLDPKPRRRLRLVRIGAKSRA